MIEYTTYNLKTCSTIKCLNIMSPTFNFIKKLYCERTVKGECYVISIIQSHLRKYSRPNIPQIESMRYLLLVYYAEDIVNMGKTQKKVKKSMMNMIKTRESLG